MKVKIDEGAFVPERAYSSDAGLDLRTPKTFNVPSHGYATVDTGVHIQLPGGAAGVLVSKSGLNINHNITSTGLIDEGYTGSIKVKLYNHGNDAHIFERGDKISQLIVVPVIREDIEIVKDFAIETDRGDRGLGSSGR